MEQYVLEKATEAQWWAGYGKWTSTFHQAYVFTDAEVSKAKALDLPIDGTFKRLPSRENNGG